MAVIIDAHRSSTSKVRAGRPSLPSAGSVAASPVKVLADQGLNRAGHSSDPTDPWQGVGPLQRRARRGGSATISAILLDLPRLNACSKLSPPCHADRDDAFGSCACPLIRPSVAMLWLGVFWSNEIPAKDHGELGGWVQL